MMNESASKRDILLVFINLPIGQEENIMSPIQIMKGMFLVKNELKMENFYEFEPYLYGPCSFQIYSDLLVLVEKKLIETISSPYSWKYYRITPLGSRVAEVTMKVLGGKRLEELRKIKEFVMKKTFLQLLEYVYTKYPEYAKNSIINIEVLRK